MRVIVMLPEIKIKGKTMSPNTKRIAKIREGLAARTAGRLTQPFSPWVDKDANREDREALVGIHFGLYAKWRVRK